MNWLEKLRTVYTDRLPPELVVELTPKLPPKPRQPSKQRLVLNARANTLGFHIALQKGQWQLCRIGPDSATHVTWHPTLDDIETKITELEAAMKNEH